MKLMSSVFTTNIRTFHVSKLVLFLTTHSNDALTTALIIQQRFKTHDVIRNNESVNSERQIISVYGDQHLPGMNIYLRILFAQRCGNKLKMGCVCYTWFNIFYILFSYLKHYKHKTLEIHLFVQMDEKLYSRFGEARGF